MSLSRKFYAPLPPYADERRFADACCDELDTSKENSQRLVRLRFRGCVEVLRVVYADFDGFDAVAECLGQ